MEEKINNEYAQTFKDFNEQAEKDAQKNISEIERNIQAQNQRLEDEALI